MSRTPSSNGYAGPPPAPGTPLYLHVLVTCISATFGLTETGREQAVPAQGPVQQCFDRSKMSKMVWR